MNIKKAKEEIKSAIEAYLMKDEFDDYVIPVESQRPVLLMGPPGIGKTAVMKQIASECNIGLVSYTITHPMGTSPKARAFLACVRAAFIYFSSNVMKLTPKKECTLERKNESVIMCRTQHKTIIFINYRVDLRERQIQWIFDKQEVWYERA